MIIIFVTCISFQIDDTRVHWVERRNLKFSDFRGDATSKNISDADAGSGIRILQTFDTQPTQFNYNIVTVFEKDFSYMYINDSLLLIHEEKHFDIGEISARVLRKNISTHIHSLKDLDTIGLIINRVYDYQDYLNDSYDQETKHGINEDNQHKWNIKIQKMLDSLKEYENPNGTIILK